ncbi:helix-turn-helix transcriptional regulator [Proteus mirabilis]|nr:helix-turn-helix transcriptional regulator [Proteus mirabilis]
MMVRYRRANIDVNVLVGKRIQIKRKELGYTGSQLAAKLGVSQQQFSRYERGMNKIDLSYLVLLANYLNTPIHWFFEDCFTSTSSKKSKLFDKHSNNSAKKALEAFLY